MSFLVPEIPDYDDIFQDDEDDEEEFDNSDDDEVRSLPGLFLDFFLPFSRYIVR